MNTVLQIIVALLVPIVWGLLSSWIFDRLKLRRECKTGTRATQHEEGPSQ